MACGEPYGLQHGLAVHFSISLEGVAQQTLSWSYLLLRRSGSWLGYGRIGNVALTAPDANLGGELALGGAYFLTGGAGLTAELVGNLFYGAGTYDVSVTTVPTLSFTGGIIIDYGAVARGEWTEGRCRSRSYH